MAPLRVRLLAVPPVLFYAWEQHSDALLREYVLADTESVDFPYSMADVATARRARQALAVALRAVDDESGAPSREVDVDARLEDGVAPGDFSVLQGILDHAYALSVRGDFLTMPSLPEVVGLRNWVCDQVVGQAAGDAPSPWDSSWVPVEDAPLAQWPGMAELRTDRSWLVGDDRNRIIAASEPALALLGWSAGDLLGQRIISVIPPALRHAHVAAFTHAIVNGEHRLLDQPLEVNAFTAAGEEVPITLTLHHHSALRGRNVYVADLEPRSTDAD